MINQFPKEFLWGAATSSHQTEGGCVNNWQRWEENHADQLTQKTQKRYGQFKSWSKIKSLATDRNNYISATASDSYNRYAQDIELLKKIGCNAYRFSVEWSRIEPTKGKLLKRKLSIIGI